jgi:hypothetical protein
MSFRPPASPQVVHVIVPKGGTHNLQTSQRAIASALGRLGCDHCHSGFDIRLLEEEVVLVANKAGQVQVGLGAQV